MSVLTQNRCLVLNKCWTPVGTVPLQRAIIMLFSTYKNGEPKARIIDHESYQTFTWDDWSKLKLRATDEAIQGVNIAFRVPEVILLSKYDKLPQPKVHFSRRNLFKRDGMVCQYCRKKFSSDLLTIDHVTPKSFGGKSVWSNCVLCCVPCNSRKANRTPEQAGMTLRKVPKKPHIRLIKFETGNVCKSWSQFISDAYWNIDISD